MSWFPYSWMEPFNESDVYFTEIYSCQDLIVYTVALIWIDHSPSVMTF